MNKEDSDEEIPVGGFNFSVAGGGIKTDLDNESESETDGLDELRMIMKIKCCSLCFYIFCYQSLVNIQCLSS